MRVWRTGDHKIYVQKGSAVFAQAGVAAVLCDTHFEDTICGAW